jgi:hypothetical protein
MENGANPYLRDKYSQTVFEEAAGFHGYLNEQQQREKERLCKYLLNAGLSPIQESRRSPSILCYLLGCSEKFDFLLIDWLATHNCLNVPDTRDEDTESKRLPISHVLNAFPAERYNPKVLRYFIERGACTDARGITKEKLFLHACRICDLPELQMVVSAGANIHETDRNGENALFIAVLRKRPLDVIKYLVELGLDVNCVRPKSTEHSKIIPDTSVLDIAESDGNSEIIAYLKAHGARHASKLMGTEEEKLNQEPIDCRIENGVLRSCRIQERCSVYLPEGITTIGHMAFAGSKMEILHIPHGVTTIEREAISDCDYLKKIYLPDTVKELPFSQYKPFLSLQEFIVDDNNPFLSSCDGVLFNKGQTQLIRFPESHKATHYVVPKTVTSIAKEAFYRCTRLEEIILPEHNIDIGEMCFYGCKSLKKINLPDDMEELPHGLFIMSGIEELKMPSRLKIVGTCCFRYSNLKQFQVPPRLEIIRNYAFEPCDLREIMIPTTIQHPVKENVFSDCHVRFAVKFPENAYVDFNMDYEALERFSEYYLNSSEVYSDEVFMNAVEKKIILKRHLVHIAVTRLFVSSDHLNNEAKTFYENLLRANRQKALISFAQANDAQYVRILLNQKYVTKKDLKSVAETCADADAARILEAQAD